MSIEIRDRCNLLFCGDFIARNPENIKLSDALRELISECDIRCLNFEGPLPIGTPITIKGTALLPQSLDSPEWCENNGFNVISLANNHTGDYGENALRLTREAFQSALLVGAGSWDEAYEVKAVEVNDLHIGFLSVAQCEFGILNDQWSDKKSLGCAWINYPQLNDIIRKAKRSLDFLFVITHAGIEYYDFPLPEWRDRYKELIDAGADAIIGGHPHVPQGWELYKGKPVFYSLGNFFFDSKSQKEYFNNGISVVLSIDNQKRLSFKIINTLKIENEIIIDNSEKIKEHNLEICRILSNREEYLEKVNKMCLSLWRSYEATLMKSLNSEKTSISLKVFVKYITHLLKRRKPEYRYILNYVRCESHRYAISRALKLLTGVRI